MGRYSEAPVDLKTANLDALSSPSFPKTFNVFDPAIVVDPYATYAQMRESAPVYWDEKFKIWIVTRHDDVVSLLKEHNLSSNRMSALVKRFQPEEQAQLGEILCWLSKEFIFQDPPYHTRFRSLVSQAFTPRLIQSLRGNIETNTRELLDSLKGKARFDLMKEFAYPLPLIVIGDMMGVDRKDRDLLKKWSASIVHFLLPKPTMEQALESQESVLQMNEYFRAIIASRKKNPREDFITSLVKAEEAGQILSDEEIIATCTLVLVAGHETTCNLIGNTTFTLLQNPNQLEIVKAEPSLFSMAVEEGLRYECPIHYVTRVVGNDFEFRGSQFQKDQRVLLMVSSALRDASVIPNPTRFDVKRGFKSNLGFGMGIHFCPGAPLARLEGEIALEELFARFPNLKLQTEHLPWVAGSLRGLSILPVIAE